MSCQARVIDKPFPFTQVCHSTKECGNPRYVKITVDNGDASLMICKACFRCLGKRENWLGWFDCDIPPEAKVKYSRWYYDILAAPAPVASAFAPAPAPVAPAPAAPAPAAPVPALVEVALPAAPAPVEAAPSSPVAASVEVDALTSSISQLSIDKPKTAREVIQEKIDAINAWMIGEGRANHREKRARTKELMNLRTKLILLPKK